MNLPREEHKYLKRAEAAGLSWPLPEGWDGERVEAALFPRRETSVAEKNPARTQPDFAAIHEQLRRRRHLTLQLLWEEYRGAFCPTGNWLRRRVVGFPGSGFYY